MKESNGDTDDLIDVALVFSWLLIDEKLAL